MINMFGRKYKAIIKRIESIELENSYLRARIWQLEYPCLENGAKVFYCDNYGWRVGIVGSVEFKHYNYGYYWNYEIIIDGKRLYSTSLVEKYDAKSIRLKK